MTPERMQQIDAIFHDACDLAPDARAAFLAQACAGDEELRREVESLLAADGQSTLMPAAQMAAAWLHERPSASLVGQSISHYDILAPLGKGGMGEVYKARDTKLERTVALKILPADVATNAERMRRFVREAKAASALNHPHVATIYEIGEANSISFIAMEYVEGQTLAAKINKQPLPLAEIIEVGSQMADALAEAHRKGITHRDLKPANVMLNERGQVKVLDFGLAKITRPPSLESNASTLKQTAPGVVMGTVPYMSPEQALGRDVDHRSDIFSLGVVLYEMATGRLPFVGANTVETLDRILHAEPEFNADVPAALEHIVRRCLAKDRETRYQAAAEVMTALQTLPTDKQAVHQTEELATTRKIEAATTDETKAAGTRFVGRRRRMIAALAVVLLLGLGAVLYWRRGTTVQPDQINSLAVLPLENLSGDPAQEYFADGMTDALIGDLAKIGALRVISRTSAMSYKGTKKSLPQIARELQVDAIVEGTVLRSGDHLLIRTKLIHAATERHLWSENYDRDLRDLFALQSEVAQTIARAIQTKVTPAEQARLSQTHTVNRKAYDDYLQGRYLFWNKRTKENLEKAIEHFQSAIKTDPTYAQAFAGIADCYHQLGSVNMSALQPAEARRQAEEFATKALAIDSELAEAHAALGYVKHRNWEWAAAEAAFKRALALNPSYADAHIYYAEYLMTRARVEEAIAEANRAHELDPFSLSTSTLRGFVYQSARRYPEAIEQFRSIIAMDANNWSAHWYLGQTYALNQQVAEAVASAEKATTLSGRASGALGHLGRVYGLAGRKEEARQILNELLELNRHRYVTPVAVVFVYLGLGDKEQAFVWLERALQERTATVAWLKVSPIWDPLRSDPRFDDLLRRIGLTP